MWKQLSGTPYHRKASLVPLVLIDSIKLVVDSEWVYWLTTRELNKNATYSYLPSTVEARYCFLAISSHFGRILCILLGGGLSRLQGRLLWIAADIIYRNNNCEYWQAVKFIKSIDVCLPLTIVPDLWPVEVSICEREYPASAKRVLPSGNKIFPQSLNSIALRWIPWSRRN